MNVRSPIRARDGVSLNAFITGIRSAAVRWRAPEGGGGTSRFLRGVAVRAALSGP